MTTSLIDDLIHRGDERTRVRSDVTAQDPYSQVRFAQLIVDSTGVPVAGICVNLVDTAGTEAPRW